MTRHCVNGCKAPVQSPSKVLCKKCLDVLDRKIMSMGVAKRIDVEQGMSLVPGKLYIVAGQGILRYVARCGQSERFCTAGGYVYHAGLTQVVREATQEDLEASIEGHVRAGLPDIAEELKVWRVARKG